MSKEIFLMIPGLFKDAILTTASTEVGNWSCRVGSSEFGTRES